jgi:hypothetical protein
VQQFIVGRALAASHAMESHYPKGKSYWYLHYVGVRPEHQGKGWGSAAIREGLTRARTEGLPVYLETAKETNVALYRKLGFKLIGKWNVAKGGPVSGPCSAKTKTGPKLGFRLRPICKAFPLHFGHFNEEMRSSLPALEQLPTIWLDHYNRYIEYER